MELNHAGAGSAAEVVAGRNAVLESLRAGVPATALHIGPRLDSDERIGEAVTLAADAGIPVVEAGRAELDRLTAGAVHQGLVLRVRPYQYAHPDDLVERAADAAQPALIVALDGVTDPRNLGAVARSVAAFGGHGVLVPARRSAGVTAGAWKASAGALARVPVAQASNLVAALTSYQEAGPVRGRAVRGRRRRHQRRRPGRRAAGARGRLRGPRAVPAGSAAVRRAGPDPDARSRRVAERGGRRRDRAVRGGPAEVGRVTPRGESPG